MLAQHLRCWIDAQKEKYSLYFWRTKAGLEVDFILYGSKAFYAIEVKNNQIISSRDLRSLKEFCKDYPEATPLFLYRGKEKVKKGEILCMPVEEFLLQLKPTSSLLP